MSCIIYIKDYSNAKNWIFQRSCCFILACFIPILSYSQPGSSGYRFEHITVNEGLSHSDAMTVVQDRYGFIWVGTNDGIDRYDGYELKKYQLPVNPQNGLSGNRIRSMYLDQQGRLWIGAESAGLFLFDPNRDQFVNSTQQTIMSDGAPLLKLLAQSDVVDITSDAQGRLWVGTHRSGVFVLQFNGQNRLNQVSHIPLFDATQRSYRVTELVIDQSGTVWIGTIGGGLHYIDIRDTANAIPATTKVAPLASTTIRALHLDRRGDLWIGTNDRIFWVNRANQQARQNLDKYPLPQAHQGLECLYLDTMGRLWIGTNFGLHLWESQTAKQGATLPIRTDRVTTFLPLDTDPFSINSGRVHQIFEDRNQILWLAASAGGLNKVDLRHKPFMNLRRRADQQPTLPNNYINAISKDERGNNLWIGTRNGFSRYNFTTRAYRNYLSRQLPGDATGIDVSSFCQASDGNLWIGTRYNGLAKLQGEKLTRFAQLPGQLSLNSTSIERIVEDRYGTIWVATFEMGLLRFDRQGKFLQRFHTGNGSLPTNQCTFLLYDRTANILWTSTKTHGVLKLRITSDSLSVLKQFGYDPKNSTSLSVNYAWPLLRDSQGNLWIGTIGGGLNQLTTDNQGREVIRRHGAIVPQRNVESLEQDEQGHLWLAGEGLVRFNPVNRQWVRYDVADGLQSNSFKVGAACRASDGTLYVGGINGITYFQPRHIQPNPNPPLVHLTNLRIYNKPVTIGEQMNGRTVLTKPLDQIEHLKIEAAENDFSIEFVGLNYVNPQKNKYAYRLIGYNDQWVYPIQGQRTASFANLPSGNYILVVKADNGEGRWSPKPATLQITILPPWYRTWWAYLLYSAFALGALYVYQRITLVQRTLKNKLALEQFKAEKEKEVTDLKLRFFTNVSHELRTPLTLILGPLEELITSAKPVHQLKDSMMLMHSQTRKLLDLVNQLMDFRKVEAGHVSLRASQDNILPFLNEIFLIFRLKAEENQLNYAMEAPDEAIRMYFDRDKLEIVLTNLLSNAFKYTPEGGKIRLQVSVVGSPDQPALFKEGKLVANYLNITLRDWGIGMEANTLDKIFDPYFQASHTETLRIMGTGIGLSLVKQFIEAHIGEVTVASAVGVGTTFVLRLPFGQAHLNPVNIVEEKPTVDVMSTDTYPMTNELTSAVSTLNQSVPTHPFRILLVEDNDELRRYLQQLFDVTFEVFVATDGVEGWEKTLRIVPDLVVSDVMMPRSDGLELCKKIKQHPKTLHIPVMLLTARVAAVHELEGLETGADEYIAKPFNPRILHARVVAILQNRFRLRDFYQRQILLRPTDITIPDEEKQFLEKAMQVVESHLDVPAFNVQMLVREMGMSQSGFYRQIKAITGQSVVEFIRDIRLKRAAQLLTAGSLRVSEVATQVGFDDLKYFRKTFQELYNLSPSDYAKQHRESVRIILES